MNDQTLFKRCVSNNVNNNVTIEVYVTAEVADTVWTDPFVAIEPIAYIKKKIDVVADAVSACEWVLKGGIILYMKMRLIPTNQTSATTLISKFFFD